MIETDEYLSKIADHELMTRELQSELYAELDALCPERLSKGGPKKPPNNCLPVISEIAGRLYRLVISEAYKFFARRKKLEFDDLVQEGIIGLLTAIWRFDDSRGYKITTYATWWIRQSIRRGIAMQGRTIRIPVHTDELLDKMDNFIKDYEKLNGRRPTNEQIMNALEWSSRKFENILRHKSISVTPSLDVACKSDNNSYSLHTFLSSSDDDISDDDMPDQLDLSLLAGEIDCFLGDNLSAREERVIRLRFGLMPDGKGRMLREIATRFGVTRERIRQIEKEALDKLRETGKAEVLREYL